MTHRYFPHTDDDIDIMLKRCGVNSLDDLYADVPEELKLKKHYDLPPEMSEKEVRDFFTRLDKRNNALTCFAGAGFYDHYTPAVIGAILSRSEFLTAYTPYQPEISQGTLQYIFEYQSMITELTGMEVSNASMYDGTTATAEAMLMSVSHARRRNRVLVSSTIAPATRQVLTTYARYHGITVDTIDATDKGTTSHDKLIEELVKNDVAGVIVASPNFYGIIEDYSGWADLCHEHKALFIITGIASDLSVIRTPGEWGADIAAGDAQSLGMPLNYGGPYLGYLCTSKALMRKLPGRIVGATTDADNQRVFVLTLQAREQHIRREKATSNICSNQGLMALHTAVYMSVLGADGLKNICRQGYAGAHYLSKAIEETGKMKLCYPDSPFLNEFVMQSSIDIDNLILQCTGQGILPGVKIGSDRLLIAVTEMQTRNDMDKLVEIIKSV